jgi:GT2 family glycosyltransferase
MSNISLLVAVKNNLEYTKHFYQTTRALYPEVEICFSSFKSTDGTHEWLNSLNDPFTKVFHSDEYGNFSDNYNKAASLSTKDYIAFIHNDIVVAPKFIENIEKYTSPNTIVSYTTIEPPIFADHERPGKIVKDLGSDLKTFNLKGLYQFVNEKQTEYKNQTIEGISFFMCMPRKTYLEIGGLDNLYDPMFCEDIDLCVRFKLLGLKFIMSLDAISYHFVSKTSRFSQEYQSKTATVEKNSNINFIRKWGCTTKPIEILFPTKYNIAYIAENCTLPLLEILEPWCDRIYINEIFHAQNYIKSFQETTKYDLNKRVLINEYNDPYNENDIVVYFNTNKLTQNSFNTLIQLSDIIKDNGSIGEFVLDIFKITINNINPQNLIHNGTQRTN